MTSEQPRQTDAIRYALLYRLAPGIRHGLMGELQAIQFMAELAASLMALIDMNPGTLDIDIQSDADADEVELRLGARAADRRATIRSGADEHRFTWADVQLLAKAHGVPCACQASSATVRLPQVA